MSPENLRDPLTITTKEAVYSLGIIITELFDGEVRDSPFFVCVCVEVA